MQSKPHHAFMTRLAYFDDDIELIDIVRTSILNNELTDATSGHILKNVDPAKHTHLARRKNSDGSRTLVSNHLRKTVYSSYVKDIYEEVTHYMREILRLAAQNSFDSGRIVGEHSFKVSAKDVLGLGGWDKVCDMVSESIFQALESEKSTLKLFEKIASKLALGVDHILINKAVPYLEVRHFLVHANGRLPKEFIDKNSHIPVQGRSVRLSYMFISEFRDVVLQMVNDFDRCVVDANVLAAEHYRN